jgi:predicted metalloprotease with PDZ domain
MVETHLVHGKQGGTRQTAASLHMIRKEVNAILQPQANVELDFVAGDEVEHRDLGVVYSIDEFSTRREARNYGRQVKQLSKVTGSISNAHAFFVSKILGVSRRKTDSGPLGIAPSHTLRAVMVVEDMDDLKQMGRVLAHEFFHAITGTAHLTNPRTSRSDLLMWTYNDQGFNAGTYLTQPEIEKLRKCA